MYKSTELTVKLGFFLGKVCDFLLPAVIYVPVVMCFYRYDESQSREEAERAIGEEEDNEKEKERGF